MREGSPMIGRNGKNGKGKKVFEMKFDFNLKNVVLWSFFIFASISILLSFQRGVALHPEKPLSTVISDAKTGKIKLIEVEDTKLTATYKDGSIVSSRKEPQDSMTEILQRANVNIGQDGVTVAPKDVEASAMWISLIGNLLPIALMIGFILFLMRQARGAQDSLFSFGQSKAKLFNKDMPKVTFNDVAGVDEAKKELEEIVDFLKNPAKYQAVGARAPKGVLLVGPSGCGKTLLARAVAGEAGVAFFSMAGSEFMEMLVGVGASVTGDTPILIRKDGEVRLLSIGEFVDEYYQDGVADRVVPIGGVQTLGFKRRETKFWGSKSKKSQRAVFDGSSWQDVGGVYRHKVGKIYEVHYLDGVICTTGDHSVFVRTQGWIYPKRVDELEKGDILVGLPMNVRHWDSQKNKTIHELKTHAFAKTEESMTLDFWNDDEKLVRSWEYTLSQSGQIPQWEIAQTIGVSQMTVSNWQRGIHVPQLLSRKLVKMDFPDKILVTPGLLKLFGFYTAEGRSNHGLEFVFGSDEEVFVRECTALINDAFSVNPSLVEATDDHALRLIYHSAHLGRFFAHYCGTGAHNKHIPPLLWDLPKEYFLSFLEGYTQGDGYITKTGKLVASSVSHQLIRELAWLAGMHGIKAGIKYEKVKGGRVIKQKPLPESFVWTLIIGKTSNPFYKGQLSTPNQFKRLVIEKVVERPYDGYVYDLCGVDNEAFFGGEKPVLLHNSRVRDLFNTAKKTGSSIIFIDEIDAIGRMRSVGVMGGHDEREQTLNQILVEMDGFTPKENVVVLAATNRGDLLDPALLRPGRFDRRVTVDLPDIQGREAILKIHCKGKPFEADVDWMRVAKRTVGFSGADLENMLNEAAILAARENRKSITVRDIEEAAIKVKLGPEKKRLQTDLDRQMTAFHEAGHAVVTYDLPHMDPVHRISIVSRGHALGFTLIPPQLDRLHETKSHLLEQITSMLGGRAAEEIVFKEMTSGASNDIDKATQVARAMVVEFGMSNLGPMNFGPTMDVTDWGKAYYDQPKLSPDMQGKIDTEVKKIIDDCYIQAVKIVKRLRKKLDVIAEALVKQETIEAEEFERLMGGPRKVLANATAS